MIEAARAKNTNRETKCRSDSFNYTVVVASDRTHLARLSQHDVTADDYCQGAPAAATAAPHYPGDPLS